MEERPEAAGRDRAALARIIAARRSVRGFSDRAVPAEEVLRLLSLARRAPSGANLQPGRFHVLSGAPLAALSQALVAAEAAGQPHAQEYDYFPEPMPAALKARQREAGYRLYAALGVERRDLAGRRAQFLRNYRFFEAPVGIVVTIDRGMGKGCFMDLGMALGSFFLAVEAAGLAACGIGALANHGPRVAEHLGLPADEMVVCGLALGHEDPDHPANRTLTSRIDTADYVTLRGFGEGEA